MKIQMNLKSLLAGTVLGAALVCGVAAAAGENTRWDYKIVNGPIKSAPGLPNLEREINTAATDGWELTQVSDSVDRGPFAVLRRARP